VIEGFTYVFKARFSKRSKKSNPIPLESMAEQLQDDTTLEEQPSVAQK
jgi:hypothetical protein